MRGMKAQKTVKVRRERHYRPHVELYHAASVHLDLEEKTRGSFYFPLSAMMFSAFTLEAYLNYVGRTAVGSGWEDFDKASPLAKLRHVACVLGVQLDPSCRPMQTVIGLLRFRNRIAHARDEHLVETDTASPEEYERKLHTPPLPKWIELATKAQARRCHEDVAQIVELLNSKLPHPETLPLHWDSWSGHASA
jgi:hypothetical protein